jgi:membrane protein
MTPAKLLSLLKRTVSEWSDDKASTQAASLAYFTIFSIAPVLIIAVAVAGLVFGEEAARGEIQTQIQGLVGEAGAKVIESMMVSASKPSASLLASIVGLLALIFGATGVFAQLQDSLNIIWKVKPPKLNGVVSFLRVRFLSFSMVLGIGFLLLVSLVLSAGLAAAGAYLGSRLPGWEVVWQALNLVISFGVITVLFAMIYKILPDVKVAWRDVWLGAAVTALLFALGKLGIGLYLGKGSVASSYGAAGSLAILLLWVYYSAMILFLGAEFTQVYARTHGSLRGLAAHEMEGKNGAEVKTDEEVKAAADAGKPVADAGKPVADAGKPAAMPLFPERRTT